MRHQIGRARLYSRRDFGRLALSGSPRRACSHEVEQQRSTWDAEIAKCVKYGKDALLAS